MRTSLNNIKAIEDYLNGSLVAEEAAVFEANLLLSMELQEAVLLQQKAYDMVQQYGRQKIKEEIAAAQQKFTSAPLHAGLLQRIRNLFYK